MQKIIIKNFGPITNAEIDIKKFLVLIGDNAIGKSTIIKLISSFSWIEKDLFRGSEKTKEWLEKENRLSYSFLPYHRIEDFLKSDSVIEFYGQAFVIKYNNKKISIGKRIDSDYRLPQIMYVPAERNFITYMRATKNFQSEGALQDFEREYFNAANNLKGSLSLPIRDFEIEYNKRHEMLYLKNKNHKIKITEAASGFQSSVPLILVSDYLSKLIQNNSEAMTSGDIREFEKEIDKILNDKNLTERQRQITISKISALSKKFNKKAFINIVEEPEQNLFPISQKKILESLIAICNQTKDNKFLISTHSPYILTILNNLLFAQRVIDKNDGLRSEVSKIINEKTRIKSDDFSAYVLEETDNGSETKSLIDEATGMIGQNYLDTVSEILGYEFNTLYEIYAKTFQRQ
ncbi:MAG: ATP-binding protein [Bacteroidetes bacterium]|nr:ATP-binding protein [Bacteroidota bacterium]MCL2302647.1 ATP-binding protein [Lentimicrobiaceae bacterium]